MHGDFEAQRHWLEITNNLPINKWYFYDLKVSGQTKELVLGLGLSTINCVSFLDPWKNVIILINLTISAALINPDWIELDKSRGLESVALISFMRKTSLFTDLIIYVPAIIYVSEIYHKPWIKKVVYITNCIAFCDFIVYIDAIADHD